MANSKTLPDSRGQKGNNRFKRDYPLADQRPGAGQQLRVDIACGGENPRAGHRRAPAQPLSALAATGGHRVLSGCRQLEAFE